LRIALFGSSHFQDQPGSIPHQPNEIYRDELGLVSL
jgi:hypothetical protein